MNGIQRKAKPTEKKLNQNSNKSMKHMMSSPTTTEDPTTMKLLTDNTLTKMLIKHLIGSTNNMEPKTKMRKSSLTNITQREKETTIKY